MGLVPSLQTALVWFGLVCFENDTSQGWCAEVVESLKPEGLGPGEEESVIESLPDMIKSLGLIPTPERREGIFLCM